MMFDWLQKILFMGAGYIFGFVFGLSTAVLGLNKFLSISPLVRGMFLFGGFIGIISIFILLKKDNKIERVKK